MPKMTINLDNATDMKLLAYKRDNNMKTKSSAAEWLLRRLLVEGFKNGI